jgi:hypothetical protein
LRAIQTVRPPSVRFVLNDSTRSGSDTRNRARGAASGHVLASVDDDGVPKDDWLECLLAKCGDQNVLSVGGRILRRREDQRPSLRPEELGRTIGRAHGALRGTRASVRNLRDDNKSCRQGVPHGMRFFIPVSGRVTPGPDTELSPIQTTYRHSRLFLDMPLGRVRD